MLDARAVGQRRRVPAFTPMRRKPRNYIGKDYDPSEPIRLRDPVQIVPAWMNRRTGEPHDHKRAKARRLSQIGG